MVCSSDGSELTLSLPIERTIDGKYRLDRLIGRGGMGAVYEAADLRLSRSVAVRYPSQSCRFCGLTLLQVGCTHRRHYPPQFMLKYHR